MIKEELAALRKSLIERNHSGLNALYLETKGSCIKILTSKNYCDEETALDVFTEAILIFRKNIISGKITSLTDPVNYLVSVCHNLIKSKNRKEKKISNKESEVRLLFYENGYNTVEESIQKEHLIKICKKALASLTKRCQQILIAFYVHNMSMKEIAEEIELSSSDVAKTLKSRCFKSWQKAINEIK